MDLAKKYTKLLNKFGVNTPLRLAHFFGQITHESGLKPIEENLRYSSKRLREIFPKYFNEMTAQKYAMKPEAIGNKIYAHRMGNGSEASGEGYKYRGRGFIQLTGKDNYTALTRWAKSQGIQADYVKTPELLLNEADAMIAALWFWQKNNLNTFADKDDVLSISKIINLGNSKTNATPHGLKERKALTEKYKKIL